MQRKKKMQVGKMIYLKKKKNPIKIIKKFSRVKKNKSVTELTKMQEIDHQEH